MSELVLDRTRAEGVYCHWETYPPEVPTIHDNILVIERVNGDCTVDKFTCARSESKDILEFLLGAR